ncbi:Fructosamine kinase-domain-containing protein [Coniochaeta sp. 2T2.1]|nr:Fructosamine kinase-domain-containing protein [Coniochaeta sp. 2T2.1]
MDLPNDSALRSLLALPPTTPLTATRHGGSSFSSTWRLTVTPSPALSSPSSSSSTPHASLNAIADAVPGFCPRSYGTGELDTKPGTWFLVTDFLELGGGGGDGVEDGKYGFPVPTCCGSTVQDNSWKTTWAEFYSECRLRHILTKGEERNGPDRELRAAVEKVVEKVVPRLLGEGHLTGVRPVVVHGDLWSGNHGRGRIVGKGEGLEEEVVFDPSSVYGHSEYELGIMRVFGGFGEGFWRQYGELVPRSEPVGEFEDRVVLYELYHYLNHYAIFGGSYKGSAMGIMKTLIAKYG